MQIIVNFLRIAQLVNFVCVYCVRSEFVCKERSILLLIYLEFAVRSTLGLEQGEGVF